MRKRTRRALAMISLVVIFTALDPLQKLLIAAPCLVALMIERDFVAIKEANRECHNVR